MLCDEPTGALDYKNSKGILRLLEAVNREFGMIIVLVTHNEAFSALSSGRDKEAVTSAIEKTDVADGSALFVDQMKGTIQLLIILSVLVMVITIYILIQSMMQRSRYSISLTKALGYQRRAVRRIFLRPGTLTVAAASLVSVPLAKKIMDYLFPYLITNFPSGMEVVVSPAMYAETFALIIVTYLLVSLVLQRHLDKVPLTEILKNVE